MSVDLECAKEILRSADHTCVLCREDMVLTTQERGILPLLRWLGTGADTSGCCAADKVVGKAAAFMYCLLGIRALYAGVLSQPALEVLQTAGIPVTYGTLVPAIRNRTGDGFCPMESAVREITEPQAAPEAIRNALRMLS